MARVRQKQDLVLNLDFIKVFLKTSIKSLIFTLLWIPVYVIRCFLVKFIQIAKPSYGKIFDHNDASMEELYDEVPPKTTIAFTLVLNGSIELKELRLLFIKNVLGAKIHNKKTGKDELRYPEFKQYQVDFAGFRIWKNDPTFNVDNHIIEEPYSENKFSNLGKIHQDATNKLYMKKRSPWEIILVRGYKNDLKKTLLVYRSHHSMADTLSLLNVLVQSLGEKLIQLPEANYKEESIFDKVIYYVMMPFYLVYCQVLGHYFGQKAQSHPFMFKKEKEPLLHIGMSQKISMSDIKQIAKNNNVTTSAVVMAAMAGGIAKSDPRIASMESPCQWALPKANHPDKLCNYHYGGAMNLPTHLKTPRERLEKCGEIFKNLKESKLYVYDKVVLFQNGTWFNPLRKNFVRNAAYPLILTNIAGDKEGFQIGGRDVEEMTMSCGAAEGSPGVLIAAFSYKDEMYVSATVKDGILTETQTQKLAELIGNEFQLLGNI